jgi:hypothetical protein
MIGAGVGHFQKNRISSSEMLRMSKFVKSVKPFLSIHQASPQ